MALQVLAGGGGGGSYQCVACESTVCGEEALRQHLESAPHRHRTIPRAAKNAKEHPSRLPHSACLPDPSTASTSQPASRPQDGPGPPPAASAHASRKPWPPAALPPGKPPPLSSSSTVTSSSCSTSGVQPSLMPRKDCPEESDLEAGRPAEPSCPQDGGLPGAGADAFRL
ncbi:zinc finger homeobox protein 3-like [Python bivittatus]|uniref:Zinc finger homeobox protein 3-like n=1 Tax=Python bivittatus TaxID=176946 RepID=A0A9F5JAB3_PYTBI|nr:zinc finger homeobox protein 3-like [Python bivittatus]